MTIKIPVEASLDQGSVNSAVQAFQQRLNQLGQSIAQANKVKFQPVDKSTLDQMQKLQAAFVNLRRVQGDLNKRIKATGQEGSGFLDLDWSKLYPDHHSRARQMQKAFEYVVGPRFSAGPASPAGGPGSGQRSSSSERSREAASWVNVGMQVAQSGMRGAGPFGGVAAGALGTGMSSGATAGIMGLVGGVAALALGRAVSAVVGKIEQAQQEAIGFDTLKRTIGDVNVSFNVLKTQLGSAARNLDMTFDESLRLGTQFAKLANVTQAQYRTIGDEVTNAGGFARSFGLDPAQATAFFGAMRQYGVTSNPQESRDLALMISEGVAKAGSFAKMDEVLEAIQGYTASQTRTGMNSANVAGYTEFLTGMISGRRAGMDPGSAAALLGRVNASIAGGGSAGEAGQNFLYSAIGARLGLSPIQARILQEQGAFGTGASTFGRGSTYARYMGREGPGANSEVTNLQMIREKLQQVYGGNKELMADAMANLLGVNISQAMALSNVDSRALGGLSARLRRNGISVGDVNATGLSTIANIEADSSLSEAEKDRRIREAATQNQEETEGSRTRASIAGVERAVTEMASQLLTPLNAIRSGIIFMAGEGKMSERQVLSAMATVESSENINSINRDFDGRLRGASSNVEQLTARRREIQQRLARRGKGAVPAAEVPALQAEMSSLSDQIATETEAANRRILELRAQREAAIAAERARLARDLDTLSRAPAPDGSGGGGGRIGGSAGQSYGTLATRGYRNNNPGNIEAGSTPWQGQVGSDGRFAVFSSPEMGYRALGRNLLAYQNRHGLNTIRGIITRWAPPHENNTAAYISAVSRELGVGPDEVLNLSQQRTLEQMITAIARHEGGLNHDPSVISAGASMALGNTPLPAGASAAPSAPQQVSVHITAEPLRILEARSGQPVGQTALNTQVGAPRPAGAR